MLRWPRPLLAGLLTLLLAAATSAATFNVDALGDAGDANPGDGVCDSILAGVDCTLRAAVQEANALAGPDTILLPAMTVVLADVTGGPSADDDLAGVGDLDITESLSILGSPGSTVEGPEGVPVVQLHSGTLTLDGLTLDGKTDIFNQIPGSTIGIETLAGTTLAASNSTIRGMLTALSLAGRSDLDEITIEENGDAVSAASGAVTSIERSTIRNNLCVTNALVDNAGTLLLIRSKIISNQCGQQLPLTPCPNGCVPGFGIRNSGVARIASSSFSGNLLLGGGSAVVQVGAAITSLDSVTIRDFQSNTEPIEVRNSIVDCRNDGTPTLVSRGHNFDYSSGGNCGFSEPSDLSSTSISWQSSPDGIPDSPTTGSPPIDSGPASCPTSDRFGNARPSGVGCDRGAVELGSAAACTNGLDDDGDGFVDLQDPGCRDASDPSEVHLRPGDFVLANSDTGGSSVFDPWATRITPIARAGGAVEPWDVLVDDVGEILISDTSMGALTRVDPERLSETFVSAGGSFSFPTGLARDPGGDVFVAQNLSDDLLAVDPLTGAQTTLLNDPSITDVDDLLFDPSDGSLLVSDPTNGLFRVSDPLGSPSVSSFSTSVVQQSRQLVFDGSGDVILADDALNGPIRFDPGTSTDTAMLGSMPFTSLQGAGAEPSGLFLFSDIDTGQISRVDEAADTVTPLNVGREEPGLRHMAMVPTPASVTLTLSDVLVIDGGTAGVADVGDTLELTAVVTNTGTGTADLLSLESGLDPNLTLVAGQLTTTQGTIVEGSLASDPRLEVDLGSLAPAASATVTWQVDVGDPAPARSVSANAWIRREKLILAESDDPSTGPSPDPNVIGVGDYGIVVQAVQKISDTRGELSGAGNPGSVLSATGLFGGSLEPLGDIDGDGVEDLAVGAYENDDDAGVSYGAFYILLMNADGTVKQRFKWNALSPDLAAALSTAGVSLADDQFGSGIAYLGDLDGAGPSDFALAVGAWYDDGLGGTDRGAVYILFMDQSPLQVLSVSKIGDGVGGVPSGQLSDFDYFGNDVEAAGDIDGDGVIDLAVGAHLDDTIGSNSGGVWILFLNQNGTVKASPPVQILVSPSSTGDFVGLGIASLGLFDGDAVPDLAVSATRRDVGGPDRGAVWILTLNANGTVKTQTEISPGVGGLPVGLLDNDDRFGRGLEVLPDLDGDGTVELVVGANRDADAGFRTGAVYALFLTPSGTTDKAVQLAPQPGVLFEELTDNDRFGLAIAPLGDLDGDGNLEIAVAAPLDNDGADDAGAFYVLNTATPVPEPAALLGLVSGAAFLAAIGRRRMRR